MSRHKRWAAKARKAEDRAIRRGFPAAVCSQCDAIQPMRAPEYDGPMAVTRGRCSVCGTPIELHDVVALLRAELHRPRPPAERLVSTDTAMLVMPHEGRMGPFASEGD